MEDFVPVRNPIECESQTGAAPGDSVYTHDGTDRQTDRQTDVGRTPDRCFIALR